MTLGLRRALLVVAASVLAFGYERAFQAGDVEQGLIKLDKEWGAAQGKGDEAALARILASDFVGSSAEGLADKAKTIADAKAGTGRAAQTTSTYDDYVVRLVGTDTAVMTHRATTKTQKEGKAVEEQSRSLHVFVKRDGRWQAVASQAIPIAKSSM